MSKRTNFFLLLTFFTTSSFAAEFCLKESENIQSARSYVQSFLLAGETIEQLKPHCLMIELPERRVELIEKVIGMKYQLTNTPSISRPASRIEDSCRLIHEIVGSEDKTQTRYGAKNSGVIVNQQNIKSNSSEKREIILSQGVQGTLGFDLTTLVAVCKKLPHSYMLTFSIAAADTSVSTTVNLIAGQKLDIGSIVKDLDEKSREISIRDGVQFQEIKGKLNRNHYISIK